ncbi:MAG: right-handed parallel beta-helix repeat-containing protein [Deltaproteobacteria bacterium]|nr:right-handed parallel beta-helix repeat-containing protein [Deltaproteobacteria bacterium]
MKTRFWLGFPARAASALVVIGVTACGVGEGLPSPEGLRTPVVERGGGDCADADGVFVVKPVECGTNTTAIQHALDCAAAWGPGSVVYLAAGTHYAGVIDVADFHGLLLGAGNDCEDGTILDTPASPDFDPECLSEGEEPLLHPGGDGWVSWLRFEGGDFTMADMCLQPTSPTPAAFYAHPFGFGMAGNRCPGPDAAKPCNHIGQMVRIAGTETYASIDNVSFQAAPGTFNLWAGEQTNAQMGVFLANDQGPAGFKAMFGSHTVEDSYFSETVAGVFATGLAGGQPGRPPGPCPDDAVDRLQVVDNTFDTVSFSILPGTGSCYNYQVSDNEIRNGRTVGVQARQWISMDQPYAARSTYTVTDNDIEVTTPYMDGIDVMDGFSGDLMDVEVSDNKIEVQSGWGGLYVWQADGIRITDNTVVGSWFYGGIYIEDSDCVILDDNTIADVEPQIVLVNSTTCPLTD